MTQDALGSVDVFSAFTLRPSLLDSQETRIIVLRRCTTRNVETKHKGGIWNTYRDEFQSLIGWQLLVLFKPGVHRLHHGNAVNLVLLQAATDVIELFYIHSTGVKVTGVMAQA